MKKNSPLLTIIVGFIAGLVLSGVLGDIIVIASNAVGRISAAWSVSKAERHIAGGNFDKAKEEYEKALGKIRPGNKRLLAKVKNNTALIVFTEGENEKDPGKIEESILMFSQSLELYRQLNDSESIKQAEANIRQAQGALEFLER